MRYLKITNGRITTVSIYFNSNTFHIYSQVRDRIRKSGFFVDDNAVGVLSGVDEGVFSWVTVNLLLDRLKTVVSKNAS